MLSTGIKNFILIILIILIFHFLIKNVLLSKKEHYSTKCDVKSSNDGGETQSEPATTKDTYDAWFGPDQVKSDDIDKYFKGETDVKKEAEKAAQCPIPVKDLELPLSSTCDVNFEKLPSDVLKKDVKANCNLQQDKKNIMILNEYENESVLNGGKLFMNLDAYDNLDSMFAPL